MRPAPNSEAGGVRDGRRPGPPFRNRRHAGRALGERLCFWADAHPVVLGLPRGGVPVGYEVARALGAPLDVIVARKIGAPGNPELGLGAVAEDGVRVFNAAALRIPLEGRTAIVVDDGLATGGTALAALRAVRHRSPRTLVLAAPVGASTTVAALAHEVDHVVCLVTPRRFRAIAECYDDFDQTSDADVIRLLLACEREPTAAA